MLIGWGQVKRNTELEKQIAETVAAVAAGGVAGPLSTVIRSKGFVWLATHHMAAVYWSHAVSSATALLSFLRYLCVAVPLSDPCLTTGARALPQGDHFELKNVGTWWAEADPAVLPGGKLPPAVADDFEGEFGDRRQEVSTHWPT